MVIRALDNLSLIHFSFQSFAIDNAHHGFIIIMRNQGLLKRNLWLVVAEFLSKRIIEYEATKVMLALSINPCVPTLWVYIRLHASQDECSTLTAHANWTGDVSFFTLIDATCSPWLPRRPRLRLARDWIWCDWFFLSQGYDGRQTAPSSRVARLAEWRWLQRWSVSTCPGQLIFVVALLCFYLEKFSPYVPQWILKSKEMLCAEKYISNLGGICNSGR